MSVLFTSRVWENSQHKGTDRLMLLAIADSANKDSGIAFPGMITLAKMMGPKYSRRAAGQRVETLAHSGELAVFPRKGGSHDYIVVLGMGRAEIKTAYKKLAARRHIKVSALIDLRRSFASGEWSEAHKSSRVGAKPTSQGVRSPLRTNRKEPEVNLVVVPETTTTPNIFAIWEQESRTHLSPFLRDELGDMIDTHGVEDSTDAIKEAVKSAGVGQFNVKYVWHILERWQREGKGSGRATKTPPAVRSQPKLFAPPPPVKIATGPAAMAIIENARKQIAEKAAGGAK